MEMLVKDMIIAVVLGVVCFIALVALARFEIVQRALSWCQVVIENPWVGIAVGVAGMFCAGVLTYMSFTMMQHGASVGAMIVGIGMTVPCLLGSILILITQMIELRNRRAGNGL